MQKTFLVSVSNPIVHIDLREALADTFPQADVVSLERLDDLARHIDPGTWPVCVIWGNPVWSDAAIAMLRTVADNGGRVVALGPAPSQMAAVITLPIPFNDQMLRDALLSDVVVRPETQPEART